MNDSSICFHNSIVIPFMRFVSVRNSPPLGSNTNIEKRRILDSKHPRVDHIIVFCLRFFYMSSQLNLSSEFFILCSRPGASVGSSLGCS